MDDDFSIRVGFGKRLGAFIIDTFIISVITFAIILIFVSGSIFYVTRDYQEMSEKEKKELEIEIKTWISDFGIKITNFVDNKISSSHLTEFKNKLMEDLERIFVPDGTGFEFFMSGEVSEKQIDSTIDILFLRIKEYSEEEIPQEELNELRDELKLKIKDSPVFKILGDLLGGLWRSIISAFWVIAIVSSIYYLLEGFIGASVGKLMLGIKIARTDDRKGNIVLYLIRFFIKNSGVLLSVIGTLTCIALLSEIGIWLAVFIILGCFLVLTKPKKALHDIIAGTAIYNKKDLMDFY